jgi:hypothetical protein
MRFFVKSLLSVLLLASLSPIPAWAKGEISVENSDGAVDTYSGVEISNTNDIIYFKDPEGGSTLLITKNECSKEGDLLVCNKARMGIDTDGILEELAVKEIHLFINETNKAQPIQGSQVTMSPGTILLEAVTNKGAYITGLGKIDSTTKPAGASR